VTTSTSTIRFTVPSVIALLLDARCVRTTSVERIVGVTRGTLGALSHMPLPAVAFALPSG
jgi:hypothetical protein